MNIEANITMTRMIVAFLFSMTSLHPICENLENEKKLFVVEEYINTIGMVKTFIEFDIYQMCYELYYSGTHVGFFENKEDALYEYHQCIEKLHHIYDKYESHERFLKSRHLHIRHYIEEASMQNLPLEECLINHLGKEQGHFVYKEYVS